MIATNSESSFGPINILLRYIFCYIWMSLTRLKGQYLKTLHMKTRFKIPTNTLAFIALLAVSSIFMQCKKAPTEGKISLVYLSTGLPVSGATVKLFIKNEPTSGFFLCNSPKKLTTEQEYVTNSSGVLTECFELPALVDVYASYTLPGTLPDTTGLDSTAIALILANSAGVTGEGKLNLIQHETTAITIKMN